MDIRIRLNEKLLDQEIIFLIDTLKRKNNYSFEFSYQGPLDEEELFLSMRIKEKEIIINEYDIHELIIKSGKESKTGIEMGGISEKGGTHGVTLPLHDVESDREIFISLAKNINKFFKK
jgi:hypothetical protein